MKALHHAKLLILQVTCCMLCLSAGNALAALVKIDCIGDSLTVGYTNPTSWTVPYTFGYRGGLYTRLANAGYNVQYVGNSGEPWSLPFGSSFGVPATVQGVDLRALGQDKHRGYGGVTTSQLLNGGHISGSLYDVPAVDSMLMADSPDVVLLMVGINGITDAMTYLDPLVNRVVTTKPSAKLIVAQITPRSSFQQAIVNYNTYIRDTVVPKYQALGYSVTTVDQYSNLLTNKSDLTSIDTSLYCDSAHLKPEAYDRLAATWFAGIQSVVAVPEPSSFSLLLAFGILLVLLVSWRCRRPRANRQFARPAEAVLAMTIVLGMTHTIASAGILRIMPLGDSITAGTTDPSWQYPFSFGYRGSLYTRLTNAGYDFQFVGASPEPWNGVPYGVPPKFVGPDLRTLNQNGHRGYGGSSISDIANGNGYDPGIVASLNADDPDIVLLMIGINDIARYGNGGNPVAAETGLNNLVKTIFDTKPAVNVIVAQINTYKDGSLTKSVTAYNDYIKDTLVPSFAGSGYHISTVDQFANFLNVDQSLNQSLYSNIIHPNAAGYDLMANTWFEGIKATQTPEPNGATLCGILGLGMGAISWHARGHAWFRHVLPGIRSRAARQSEDRP